MKDVKIETINYGFGDHVADSEFTPHGFGFFKLSEIGGPAQVKIYIPATLAHKLATIQDASHPPILPMSVCNQIAEVLGYKRWVITGIIYTRQKSFTKAMLVVQKPQAKFGCQIPCPLPVALYLSISLNTPLSATDDLFT